MSISASDVAKLRKTTGAGMMDCKKALTEANGDLTAPPKSFARRDRLLPANVPTARLRKAT